MEQGGETVSKLQPGGLPCIADKINKSKTLINEHTQYVNANENDYNRINLF